MNLGQLFRNYVNFLNGNDIDLNNTTQKERWSLWTEVYTI